QGLVRGPRPHPGRRPVHQRQHAVVGPGDGRLRRRGQATRVDESDQRDESSDRVGRELPLDDPANPRRRDGGLATPVSDEDPGWCPLLWRASISLIPVFGLLYLRRRRPSDALTEFRFVWLGIVVSLWLFAFVLLFVVPTD